MRFAESAVRAMGRLATGVRGIKLALTNDIADDESAVEIEEGSDVIMQRNPRSQHR